MTYIKKCCIRANNQTEELRSNFKKIEDLYDKVTDPSLKSIISVKQLMFMGESYLDTNLLGVNLEKAKKWFGEAAQRGNPQAKEKLAQIKKRQQPDTAPNPNSTVA